MRVARHFTAFGRCGLEDMVGALAYRAQERPDACACLMLEDGERAGASLTYAELDLRARRIATWLKAQYPRGARVLLSFPAGVDFIAALFGCFYAGMIAAPGPPARGIGAATRLAAMARDSEAALALTTGELESRLAETIGVRASRIDACLDAEPSPPLTHAPARIALLQYTSGSTGDPKGVIISHRALWANEAVIRTCFGHEEGVRLVGWLPNFHDMGLVGNLLQPIYAGGLTVIIPPAAFIQRPLRWLRAISRYEAHTSGAPNFAYDLCVRAAGRGDAPVEDLELANWRVAFNGAEPVRPATIAAFSRRFASSGFASGAFMPCYGLAESTLMVAGGLKGAGAPSHTILGKETTPCGAPVAGVPLLIADPETGAPLPNGDVGEILVGGESLCDGYWGREGEELFRSVAGARLLRTGDLGVRTSDGLAIVGRVKDVIILNGRNVHPADLEALVEAACADLGATRALVVGVVGPASEAPLLFLELSRAALRALQPGPIIAAARVAAGMEAPLAGVVLLKPGAMPLTSSGKVRRAWCRQTFQAGELAGVAYCDQGAASFVHKDARKTAS